tara:strand:- start:5141 stop:5263 length:123 start_codon:yes stop_codon:yes gene_type:complete
MLGVIDILLIVRNNDIVAVAEIILFYCVLELFALIDFEIA